MGMFDYLKSSKDIGKLTNIECQTKDIEDYIGGTMNFYWIDPAGVLWTTDYSDTADFVINDDDEDLPSWKRMKIIPNGIHGKVYRKCITKYILIYDSTISPDGLLEWDHCRLHFVDGVLQSYLYK